MEKFAILAEIPCYQLIAVCNIGLNFFITKWKNVSLNLKLNLLSRQDIAYLLLILYFPIVASYVFFKNWFSLLGYPKWTTRRCSSHVWGSDGSQLRGPAAAQGNLRTIQRSSSRYARRIDRMYWGSANVLGEDAGDQRESGTMRSGRHHRTGESIHLSSWLFFSASVARFSDAELKNCNSNISQLHWSQNSISLVLVLIRHWC